MDNFNFRKLLEEIAEAIKKRTISIPDDEKMERYGGGEYNAAFSFLEREAGKLLCVWCGNRIKTKTKKQIGEEWKAITTTEPEIYRLCENTLREGLTVEEWDAIGAVICEYRGIK